MLFIIYLYIIYSLFKFSKGTKKLNKLKLTSLNETFLVDFNVLTFLFKKSSS